MLKRSIALLTCSMLVFPATGYSWGNKGHETVGRIAQLFLQDDNAQTTLDNIHAILKPGESLPIGSGSNIKIGSELTLEQRSQKRPLPDSSRSVPPVIPRSSGVQNRS